MGQGEQDGQQQQQQQPAGGGGGFSFAVPSAPAAQLGSVFGQQQQPPQQQPPQQQQQQQQPPPQQQPSIQPLTARSTVVHASGAGPPGSSSTSSSSKQAVPIKQPVAAEGRRNKVPLEKGFSQVSWIKLARSGADLTGGAGRRRDVTLAEVGQHKAADDAWMVLHGKVYNVTPYLRYHPGGADILVKAAGHDGTSLFNRYHPWVNAGALLEACLIGPLAAPAEDGDGGSSGSKGGGDKGGSLRSRLAHMLKP